VCDGGSADTPRHAGSVGDPKKAILNGVYALGKRGLRSNELTVPYRDMIHYVGNCNAKPRTLYAP
jgi:hypothetical protein